MTSCCGYSAIPIFQARPEIFCARPQKVAETLREEAPAMELPDLRVNMRERNFDLAEIAREEAMTSYNRPTQRVDLAEKIAKGLQVLAFFLVCK